MRLFNAFRAVIVLVCLSLSARADKFDWFVVLDDTNGFYASPGVPQSAVDALKSAQTENFKFKTLTFTPSGGWILLHDRGYEASDKALPASQKLQENKQHKWDAKFVTFAPTGLWTIFSGWNGFWIPGGGPAWNKIGEVARNQQEIHAVAYGPEDSWVVLFDKTSIGYGGVPANLAKVLDNAISNNIAIRCVAFSGRDWICLAQDNWWASDINLPAAKIIDQDFKRGLHPWWVAFVPYNPPFDADTRHHAERTLLRRVQVSYTMTLSPSPETQDGILKQYALLPPDTEMQKLVACHVSCLELPHLPEVLVADENDSTRFDKMIRIPLANGLLNQPLHLEISYTLDLFDVELREGADDSGMAVAKPTIFDMRPTKCIDYTNSVFQDYLREHNLIRVAGESNLKFAYRAYRILCADLAGRVRADTPDNLPPQASSQCRGQFGGCGSCSMQFVAILRENLVPARVVVGRWAKNQDGDYGQWHVKTDFYDSTVGWIPVDPTFGFGDCRDGNNIDPPFGNFGADFITMHLNTEVHPWHSYFEMPMHQFGVSRYEGSFPFHPTSKENWAVETLPKPKT